MTVVDRLNRATDPRNTPTWHPITRTTQPVEVTWTINIQGWKSALLAALK